MNCAECGSQLDAGQAFCGQCGQRFIAMTPPPVAETPTPVSNLYCVRIGCAERGVATTAVRCATCGHETFPERPITAAQLEAFEAAEQAQLDGDDEEAEVVLKRFDTPNPWLNRLFQDPEFGRAPAPALQLLREVTPDLDEKLLLGLRTRHGRYQRGYLLATTHVLRWVQTIPSRSNGYWPYDYALELAGGITSGGVLRTMSGDQFQVRYSKAKSFLAAYQVIQQAHIWELSNPPASAPIAAPAASAVHGDLAGQLTSIIAMHSSGSISDEEFTAAKSRLLGL